MHEPQPCAGRIASLVHRLAEVHSVCGQGRSGIHDQGAEPADGGPGRFGEDA
jgi:hypothetical protein